MLAKVHFVDVWQGWLNCKSEQALVQSLSPFYIVQGESQDSWIDADWRPLFSTTGTPVAYFYLTGRWTTISIFQVAIVTNTCSLVHQKTVSANIQTGASLKEIFVLTQARSIAMRLALKMILYITVKTLYSYICLKRSDASWKIGTKFIG